MDNDKPQEEDELRKRFPDVPTMPELPPAPKVEVQLPPHPARRPGGEPGEYNKLAVGAMAASSLITPIIVLAVGGYFVDQRYNSAPWGAFVGLVVGFIVGVSSLLRIIRRLQD